METPAEVRIPWWVPALGAAAIAAGVAQGLLESARAPAEHYLRCVYPACAYLYLALSVIDFAEHSRLATPRELHRWPRAGTRT